MGLLLSNKKLAYVPAASKLKAVCVIFANRIADKILWSRKSVGFI